MDDLCAIFLGLSDPLKGHMMVFSHITAFHQDRLAVLQVNPVVGHRSPAEGCPQTGDRGAVSKPGLMLDVSRAQQPRCFLEEIALFVGILRTTHKGDRVCAVDWDLSVTEFFSSNPCFVTYLVDLFRNAIDRIIPRDIFPMVAARRPITWRAQSIGRSMGCEHGDAFHA